jgi:hypothetical protein
MPDKASSRSYLFENFAAECGGDLRTDGCTGVEEFLSRRDQSGGASDQSG